MGIGGRRGEGAKDGFTADNDPRREHDFGVTHDVHQRVTEGGLSVP